MKMKLIALSLVLISTPLMAGEPWDSAYAPEKTIKLVTGQDVSPSDLHVEEGKSYDAASSSFMEGKQKVALVVLNNIHACRVIIITNDKLAPGEVRIKKMHARLRSQAKIAKRVITVGDNDQELTEVLIDGNGFTGPGDRICCGCAQALIRGGVPLNQLDAEQTKTEAITIEVHPETEVQFAGLHTHHLGFLPEGLERETTVKFVSSVQENALKIANRPSRTAVLDSYDL